MRPIERATAAAIVMATAATLAACASGNQSKPRVQPSTSHAVEAAQPLEATPLPACPKPTGLAPRLPRGVPADLPMPAGARVDDVSTVAGTIQVRFTVATSFKEAAKDLLTALPARGFTLAGGDAEADEVDIPFTRGSSQFNIKLHALNDPCSAQGRLVVRAAG